MPEELVRDCSRPAMEPLTTTKDLERIANEALISLDTCSEDKARIRAWMEEE